MNDQQKNRDRDQAEVERLRAQVAGLEQALAGSFAMVTGLRESEAKYRDLFDNAMDAIFVVDADHKFVDVNMRATELFGYSKEEFLGMGIFDVIPQEQTERSAKELRELQERGRYERFRGKMRAKDGAWRDVEVSASAILVDGRVVGSRDIVRDVTEQVRAELQVRQEKNRSEAIIAAIGDGISIQDREFRILYQNEVHKGFVGSHIGELCYKAYESSDETCDNCPVAQAFRDGGVHVMERTVTIAGMVRHFEISASALRGAAGDIIAGIEVVREITERKHIEDSLRDERNFVTKILDTVEALILVLDAEGRIIRFNRACERCTGFTFAEVRGKHVWDVLIPPEQVAGVKEVFGRLTAGMFPNTHMNHWLTRNGPPRLISWNNTALVDASGEVQFVVPTGIDVTEQERAEEEILRSGERYRSIFNNASVSLWEEDFSKVMEAVAELRTAGVADFRRYFEDRPEEAIRIASLTRIVDVNDFTLKLYGARSKEELVRSLDQFLTPESAMAARDLIIAMAERWPWFEAETTNRTIDGRKIDILLTVTIPTETSSFEHCLVSIMDITAHKRAEAERRKLQTQLLQSQKIEAIGLLAGGIAHDFNNILSAILGYASIIQMKMRADDPLRGHVEEVISASERAGGLVQSLLAFSRKQIIDPRPLDLTGSIQRIEKLLRRLIGEDIEFRTRYHDQPLTVVADPVQLEQVVINLVTNARDAMPQGGAITLATVSGEIEEEFISRHGFGAAGRYAVLSVADTGIGMDEGTRAHIFEPFFTTKEQGKGTGLGLSTVYGIVKQNNGFIICENAPEKGTVFRMYLPLADASPAAAEKAGLSLRQGLRGTETVLIAEDDEAARKLFQAVFEEHGYSVIAAADGEEALDRFRRQADTIRLLVLDVIMPRKNGREVYEEARRIRPDVRALFTSGYTADIIHAKGVLDPSIEFLAKPVLPADLLKKAREVLDRK